MSSRRIALISRGKLVVKEDGGPARAVESKFATEVVNRSHQIQQRNAWKMQGTGAKFMSRGMLWGNDGVESAGVPVMLTGLGRGRSGRELVYSLWADRVVGLFS